MIICTKTWKGGVLLKELIESEVFCSGVAVGINLLQQKVVNASKMKEPIKIDGELYYVQTGSDRLIEMLERICE